MLPNLQFLVFYGLAVVAAIEVAVAAVALAAVAAAVVVAPEPAVHGEAVVVAVDEVAVVAVVAVDGAAGVEFVIDAAVESAVAVFAASAVASQRAAIFAGSADDCSTPSGNTSVTLQLNSYLNFIHYENFDQIIHLMFGQKWSMHFVMRLLQHQNIIIKHSEH